MNDYHLLLLPQMLRAKLPTATIGFFLHVAFPSSEIFRCLSVRAPLLRGLLAADLVGFQTANHARHFRQTVSRILALEATPKGIQAEDRFVDVGVFPMGIDVGRLRERRCVVARVAGGMVLMVWAQARAGGERMDRDAEAALRWLPAYRRARQAGRDPGTSRFIHRSPLGPDLSPRA